MEKITWIEEYLEQALTMAWDESHERALRLLDPILFEEPGYARLHNTLGIIYMNHAEDIKKAEQHFRLAIQFDMKFADSYWHLGRLLADDERLDEAIEIFERGLKAKQARKTGLLAEIGKAYELKKKFTKAINRYKKALGYSAELWNCIVLEESIKRCKRKQK